MRADRTKEKNIRLLEKAVELERSGLPAGEWLADQYRTIFRFLNDQLDDMERL